MLVMSSVTSWSFLVFVSSGQVEENESDSLERLKTPGGCLQGSLLHTSDVKRPPSSVAAMMYHVFLVFVAFLPLGMLHMKSRENPNP